jgi:NitT/TauT family transport system permease protein
MAVDASRLEAELAGLDALESAGFGDAGRGARLWSALWPKLAAVALLLLVWQAVVWSGWKPTFVLPGPQQVFPVLWQNLATAEFWEAVARTMRRAFVGYSAAVVAGVLIGVSVSRLPRLRVAVGSLITGLQTMPSIAWFPLAILLLGLSEGAILFVVVLGAAPSVANGLIGGVDHVPPLLLRAGRTLGARGLTLYRHVILPASLPSFLAGLKQGWAFAWRSLMAGELIVTLGPSIGQRLQYARELADAPMLLAFMVVVLVIGFGVDALFGRADAAVRRRWGLVDPTR